MSESARDYTWLDRMCLIVDQGLRTLTGQVEATGRTNPAADVVAAELTPAQQQASASYMRVNQVGEICAQALYQGQALTASSPELKASLLQAAREENDHLLWCNQRLSELNSHSSYLNPFWYSASYALGAITGLLGDRWSLGFVVATERQVEEHLADHLKCLPENDAPSRAIVSTMQADEIAHAEAAERAGAAVLPAPVQKCMRIAAKIMTTTAYWV